jgi:hypothetical protein
MVSTKRGVSLLAVPMLSGRQAEHASPASANASTPDVAPPAAPTYTSASLEDGDLLRKAAGDADAVVNAASADHRASGEAMLEALGGSNKPFLHTSGSSIVGSRAGGEPTDKVHDETTAFQPARHCSTS